MTEQFDELERRIEALVSTPSGDDLPAEADEVVEALLAALEAGTLRSARRDADGKWHAVPWVKRGILLAFRAGRIVPAAPPGGSVAPDATEAGFFDKHNLPARTLSASDGVRVVPGGSSIRRGSHVAPGVICMPPMYVNVGAWVGAGTMIDSHALVGSCAQVGERVHLSAAAQVGGVLEPVNAAPVVIEDDVVVGGNAGVYEGTIVRDRAVLGAGVVLTRGTPIYDLVRETVHRAEDGPLEVPSGAVVVGGARAVGSPWARERGLSLYTPVIVKYRDEKTDLATVLEEWLR